MLCACARFADIVEAAKAANAHDFITDKFEDGYETKIGERAVRVRGVSRSMSPPWGSARVRPLACTCNAPHPPPWGAYV